MAVEQTLSIIKPDGVQKNLIGEIYGRFEKAGLEIVAARMMHLSKEQAQGFYDVHKERPFFNDLVNYMTSGPVVVQVLQGDDAIGRNRENRIMPKPVAITTVVRVQAFPADRCASRTAATRLRPWMRSPRTRQR